MIHAAINLPGFRSIVNVYKQSRKDAADSQRELLYSNNHVPPVFLTRDIFTCIFSYFSPDQLEKCSLVSKDWNLVAGDPLFVKMAFYQHKAFGPEKWAPHIHVPNLDEECKKAIKSLPDNISKSRKQPSLAFPGKSLVETEILTWIPGSLTNKALGDLLKSYFPDSYIQDLENENDEKLMGRSRWVSMMTGALPGSYKMPFESQEGLVANLAKESKIDYKVPTTLVAQACVLSHYITSGERLFGDASRTLIRLQDLIQGKRVMFGIFSSDGPLLIALNTYDEQKGFSDVGITAFSEVKSV